MRPRLVLNFSQAHLLSEATCPRDPYKKKFVLVIFWLNLTKFIQLTLKIKRKPWLATSVMSKNTADCCIFGHEGREWHLRGPHFSKGLTKLAILPDLSVLGCSAKLCQLDAMYKNWTFKVNCLKSSKSLWIFFFIEEVWRTFFVKMIFWWLQFLNNLKW